MSWRTLNQVAAVLSMRRLTRLTNGFPKKLENHAATVALYFHILQLRPCASGAPRNPSDGSGHCGSRVVH
jgi:hypothetical protein